MTDESMPLLELLQKRGGGDFLKELAEAVLQRLMEFEAEGLIGAGRWERSDARTTQRNGYRDRALTPGSARSSCAFPNCGTAAISRPFSNRARPPSGRSSRSFRRLGSSASRHARSTTWCRRWG